MAEGHYQYSAIDPQGRRVRGVLAAPDDSGAFDALRQSGLSPVSLRRRSEPKAKTEKVRMPRERDSADFLTSLADLLAAGADIRTSLGILSQRSDKEAVRALGQRLTADISSGDALERAFARSFQNNQAFVASMVAAGEAGGDIAEGLRRAGEIIYSRLKLRDQLVSVLSYPGFVLLSAIAAVLVILLFIVPSIAPLAKDSGSTPTASLALLISASDFLRGHIAVICSALASAVAALAVAARLGLLNAPLESVFLDGPAKRTARGVVFGGFAISLGTMLSAVAAIREAIRLAARSVRSNGARRRLDAVVPAVRQGQSLSQALLLVKGFPQSMIRLAAVGEASNSLGVMLTRGGKLEEEAALRRIEVFGQIAGPALIVLIGAILGALMGGLLSGISQMGQAALG